MSVHRVLPRARTQRSPPTSGSEAELQGSPAPGDRLGPLQSSGDVVRTHVERVSSRPLIRRQSLNFAFKSTAARTISPALLRWFFADLSYALMPWDNLPRCNLVDLTPHVLLFSALGAALFLPLHESPVII